MSILHTIREIIRGESAELLDMNTPQAVKLAQNYPVMYVHRPSQRAIDRKLVDYTVCRFYLSKNRWTYSPRGANGRVDTYYGTLDEWRKWCSDEMVNIARRLKATTTHAEYLEVIGSKKEHVSS